MAIERAGPYLEAAAIETKLDHGTHGLAALKALIDAVEGKLDDGTSGLAALKALIDAAEVKLDKLAGSEADTQVAGKDLTAAGGGTSGENGADILTISTTTRKKVHMLIVSMKNCQAAATITVRMYTKVNATFEKFYDQAFTQGTDPDAIMAINGTLAILADLRVEMHSSDALDNNVTVPYSYILEDME